MAPGQQHGDEALSDFPFGEEHFKELMLEDCPKLFELKGRGETEHAFGVKASICAKNMAVGIKSQEIPEALYSNNCPGHCILPGHIVLEKHLQ